MDTNKWIKMPRGDLIDLEANLLPNPQVNNIHSTIFIMHLLGPRKLLIGM